MSSEALAIAWSLARKPLEREHTTPYLWDNPDRFRIRNVVWETGLDYSQTYRLTLDYPEDYALIRAVYAELWSPDRHFTLAEIVELLASRPDLCARNSKHIGTSWYRNHPGELRTLPELGGSR